MTNTARHALVVCGFAAFLVTAVPAFADKAPSGADRYAGPYGASHGESAHFRRHRFGADPDPNIRFEISRTRNWRKG